MGITIEIDTAPTTCKYCLKPLILGECYLCRQTGSIRCRKCELTPPFCSGIPTEQEHEHDLVMEFKEK